MMKLLNAAVSVWKLVARYPALSAGLSQVVILIAAQVGLSLTTTQLASIAGVVATIFAVLVHAGVIPVTKVDNVQVGIKPVIQGQASVLSTPDVGQVNTVPPIEVVENAIVPLEGGRNPFGPTK